jgi:hypothetical protein
VGWPRTSPPPARPSAERSTHSTMQLSLQVVGVPIPHRQAISDHPEVTREQHVHAFAWCPSDGEPTVRTHVLIYAQLAVPEAVVRRLSSALLLIRSFLLLEDESGWEAHPREPSAHRSGRRDRPIGEEPAGRPDHPHRVRLRPQPRSRRRGAARPREQVCLCPIRQTPPATRDTPRYAATVTCD